MTHTSEPDGNKTPDPVENLTGAHALNAVTPDERAALDEAAQNSATLRAEMAQFSATAAVLADAVEPVAPSAGLKAAIFAQLDATPQVSASAHTASEAEPYTGPGAATHAAVAPEAGRAARPAPTSAEQRAHDRWFRRPLVLVATAAAALALILGAVTLPTLLSNTAEDPFQVVAAASDAQRLTSTMDDGAQVTLVWSGELALAAIEFAGMPALPETNDYELWFIGDDGARSAGLIRTDSAGDARQQLAGAMRVGESIGITVEPAGGSPAPPTAPLLVVATS